MNSLFVICLCMCTVVVMGQDTNTMQSMPQYDVRYNYLDIDAIIDSKRLVRNYVDCLINIKPCTPEGKALKRILPEALRTKCVRCSERQKRTAVKVIKRLKYEYPEEWSKLSSRWDPTGDFTRYFEEYLAKEHFNSIPGVESGNDLPAQTTLLPKPPATYLPPPNYVPLSTFGTANQVPVDQQPSNQQPANQQPGIRQPTDSTTSMRPLLVNRFGDEGDLMMGGSSSMSTASGPSSPPVTTRPTSTTNNLRPRPTQAVWIGASSDAIPTRFPLRPGEIAPPFTTAMTIIDHIGYKIIRTTELVTDILKNSFRTLVGR